MGEMATPGSLAEVLALCVQKRYRSAMAISPNHDQFLELAQASERDKGPVVMLNLLKFKRQAEGEPGTGAEAYMRYGDKAMAMVEERGGRILWRGRPTQILIGEEADGWDAVALVEYPSRKVFLEMVSQPSYLEAHAHREHGLERTVPLACQSAEG